MSKLRIAILKRKVAAAYQEYNRILDRYSCGATLAETISTELYTQKVAFNKAWEELSKIDPKCPNPDLRL